MGFKQFLKEDPEDVTYKGKTYSYLDPNSIVIGSNDKDVVYNNEHIESMYDSMTYIMVNKEKIKISEIKDMLANRLNRAIEKIKNENDFHKVSFRMLNDILEHPEKTHQHIAAIYWISMALKDPTENTLRELLKLRTNIIKQKGSGNKIFTTEARMWKEGNNFIMSFWAAPTKQQVIKICSALRIKKENGVYEIPGNKKEGDVFVNFDQIETKKEQEKAAFDRDEHVKSPMLKQKKTVKGFGSDISPSAAQKALATTSESTNKKTV
jgi:hypothetical protein